MGFSSKSKTLKFFLTLSLLFVLNQGCNDNNSIVPYAHVDFYLNLADPDFAHLIIPGNSVFVSGGVNGIIVYNINSEQFAAYDRTCTYNVEDNCAVIIDETGQFAQDTVCCGSEYFLLDGSVYGGPATYPLKTYRTYYDPTTLMLHVYN